MLLIEAVDQRCPVLGDMAIAELFTYDRGVLAFRQGVVIAVPGPRLGELDAQLVQVAHGDAGQRPVFRLPKDRTGALTELLDGRPTGRLMALIHRRQQADVLVRVSTDKPSGSALAASEGTRIAVLSNQSGKLLA